jgi:ATP-dependent DNA ligase
MPPVVRRRSLRSASFRSNWPPTIACAFDLLGLGGDDLRRVPLGDRKAALRKLLARARESRQSVGPETVPIAGITLLVPASA